MRIDYNTGNDTTSNFEDLLRISKINVPNSVNSSTGELVNMSSDQFSGRGVSNVNLLAYSQAYDKPSIYSSNK